MLQTTLLLAQHRFHTLRYFHVGLPDTRLRVKRSDSDVFQRPMEPLFLSSGDEPFNSFTRFVVRVRHRRVQHVARAPKLKVELELRAGFPWESPR